MNVRPIYLKLQSITYALVLYAFLQIYRRSIDFYDHNCLYSLSSSLFVICNNYLLRQI